MYDGQIEAGFTLSTDDLIMADCAVLWAIYTYSTWLIKTIIAMIAFLWGAR